MVIITLSVSLLEALIILPAHIAHSNAMKKGGKRFLINRFGDWFMDFLRDRLYAPSMRFFMANKFLAFSIPVALMIIGIGAIAGGLVRVTFFPSIASDRVQITLNMPQGTSEVITDSIISEIEAATWEVNDEFTARQHGNKQVVENTIRRIGPGTSTATLEINLLPGEERDFPSDDIANSIEEKVGPIYGIESIEYGSGSNFGGKPVSVSLTGNNISDLKGAKEMLVQKLSAMPQLKDISDNDPEGIKEVEIKLKDNAHLLGLTHSDIMSQVRSGFFGAPVQRFQRGRDEIRVWVRYDRGTRSSLKNLDDMWIVTPTQDRVPLSEIAYYDIERGDVAINHLDGKREIRVEANMKNRNESATDMLAGIRENVMPGILARYPTVTPLYEGQNREAGKLTSSVRFVLPAILFAIFALIAFTFRSYSQPLMLFIMVPFSLIGVAFGHWVHGFPINMLSWLGIIALIGIMVNDGLVLIEKFNSYLKEGLKFEDALYQAGRSRFRAIFLTSMTTIAGLAPLIFETSRQAQFLIPMAISIAYGIAVATLLTLYMLPLLLYINNSYRVTRKWLFTGVRPNREEIENAIIELEADKEEMADAQT
ncbi:MAG: efflux RND transporter permease subunit [Saprospiraceae bacterium]|nr:efflux RND transporter permease subunit [Saprospiraceae bacterium]